MASTLDTLAPPEKFTVRNDYAVSCNVLPCTLQDGKFALQTCLLPKPPTSVSAGTEKNKDILIKFVSLVTGMQESTFADVRLENTEFTTRFYDEKTGRLDIKIKLHSGEKINLEMQNIWFEYFTKRSIFYWTQLFLEDFSKGADYSELKKCIAINILNQPFHLANKIHSVYKILETEEHSELDGMLEIHFLDLTKIEKEQRSELEKWLLFIQTDEKEVRKMLAKENPLMQKAEDTMEEFYTVAEQRALYQAAWRYESDRVSMINESMRKGIAQGFSDGVRETAKVLKQLGDSVQKIMQATGLTKEEIEKL